MIAITVPSYERIESLTKLLDKTKINGAVKFVVVVKYDDETFNYLIDHYSDRAIFVDERKFGKLNACKAFNLAYDTAVQHGFDYVIELNDDCTIEDELWFDKVNDLIISKNEVMGIFSSDECHWGDYGWNIIKTTPIAHFFILKCGILDEMFDSRFIKYVLDIEISNRIQKLGHSIIFIPVKVNHWRDSKHRDSMAADYYHDKELFYKLNPEFTGWCESLKAMKFVPHRNTPIVMKPFDDSIETFPCPGA